MKLTLIFLIVTAFIHFSSGYKKEEHTTEEDGVVTTVVREEWDETNEKKGHGHGHGHGHHGDVIITTITMTENDRDNHAPARPNIKKSTVPLNRLLNEKLTDYTYSVDSQEQATLGNAGYKPDGYIGRVIAKRWGLPECLDLVPITRMSHAGCSTHGLVVTGGHVHAWIIGASWKIDQVIGYGVLEKGKCGATVEVRHLGHNGKCDHYQTSKDAEYSEKTKLGYIPHVAPTFYVWDESDHFDPEPRHKANEDKAALLTRIYNEQKTDFHYSVSLPEQETLGQAGYKFDGNMGTIVAKHTDFPQCPDLVPITRMSHAGCTTHGLVVTHGHVHAWIIGATWKIDNVIGYGVLEKGKCGANVEVRHVGHNGQCTHFQTTSAAEYAHYKKAGYIDHVAPSFYIWDYSANFVPSPRVNAIGRNSALLTRLYNEKQTDFHYSVDKQEQATLGKGDYNFDAHMGRLIAKQSDLPNCPDLVAITRMSHAGCTTHGLVVPAKVQEWITGASWKIDSVLGYAVLQKGKCGANVAVRHVGHNGQCTHFQTTSDTEYNMYKAKLGYIDHVAPTFYIWEA